MWYYTNGVKTFGPLPKGEFIALIKSGQIKSETLVWKDGFTEWLEAASVTEIFRQFKRDGPPPLPSHLAIIEKTETQFENKIPEPDNQGDLSLASAGHQPAIIADPDYTDSPPWDRFFARYLDIVIYGGLLGFSIGTFTYIYYPKQFLALTSINNEAILALFLLPPTLILIALSMILFRTTIGKAIFGIRVQSISGENWLLFNLRREFYIWISGLGLGLPLIHFFANYSQYKKVAAKKPTSYDVNRAFVSSRRITRFRRAVGIGLCLILIAGAFNSEITSKFGNLAEKQTQIWLNPITNMQTAISGKWVLDKNQTSAGKAYYFSAHGDMLDGIVALEQVDQDVTINQYAEALGAALADHFEFSSSWRSIIANGHYAKEIIGKSKSDNSISVKVSTTIVAGGVRIKTWTGFMV